MSGAPPPLEHLARASLAAGTPPNVALMNLIMRAANAAEIEALLASDEAFGPLRALWRNNPAAFGLVTSLLAELDHDTSEDDPADAVRRCATLFDRAVARDPSSSVALYALGDAALLAAATAEVADALGAWTPLRPDSRVLEIGCGIGRFLAALAPRVAHVAGADVSAGMIDAARASCAGLSNVSLRRSGGCDLSFQPDRSVDLVLFADSFPYLVLAGGDLPSRHVAESARVLRPGGLLAVLNFSYRGDVDADRRDAAAYAAAAGLMVERLGMRDFRHWDGASFLFRKPVPARPGA